MIRHLSNRYAKLLLLAVGFPALVAAVFLTTDITTVNDGYSYDGCMYGAMAGSELYPDCSAAVVPTST